MRVGFTNVTIVKKNLGARLPYLDTSPNTQENTNINVKPVAGAFITNIGYKVMKIVTIIRSDINEVHI